jgi:hypothetical protein
VILTSDLASIAVNALVTGLIVFKIVKVFLEVKDTTTSVERTLGLGSTGGTKFRHVIFIIIESAMALFAIQVLHLGFAFITSTGPGESSLSARIRYNLIGGIAQMFNVIIRFVHLLLLLFY